MGLKSGDILTDPPSTAAVFAQRLSRRQQAATTRLNQLIDAAKMDLPVKQRQKEDGEQQLRQDHFDNDNSSDSPHSHSLVNSRQEQIVTETDTHREHCSKEDSRSAQSTCKRNSIEMEKQRQMATDQPHKGNIHSDSIAICKVAALSDADGGRGSPPSCSAPHCKSADLSKQSSQENYDESCSSSSTVEGSTAEEAFPPIEKADLLANTKEHCPPTESHKRSSKVTVQQNQSYASSRRQSKTMGYRYAVSAHSDGIGFVVPPVFPKTCSLYDSTYSGGAFANSDEDRKLMEALEQVRRKIQRQQRQATNVHQQSVCGEKAEATTSIDDSADFSDSGHSSLVDGGSFSFTDLKNGETERPSFLSSDSLTAFQSNQNQSTGFEPNQSQCEDKQHKKSRHLVKRQSDAGISSRKNSRKFFFLRQRSKWSFSKKDSTENEESNELPSRHWTIDATKGKSWKRKFLRTLSAGTGITFVGANDGKEKEKKGEKPSDQFGNLNREWEVVTVRELCRRLSLEDSFEPSEMPLPEGALQSQVLDEFMIRQIVDILPPRAEGYPWVNIYNSEKHGFSLATLFRKMLEWEEEMSPVLLIIRDTNGHVFGAVTSTALRPSDHYYGTGDSCLLFRFTGEYPHTRELRTYTWTGNNQFFVNATKDFLSLGASGGQNGLWLDADLNHGRSQKCATFDNEPLAGGQDEDFVVQFVEAFGFTMS